MKMKIKLMMAFTLSLLSGALVANDNLDMSYQSYHNTGVNNNISLVIKKNSSVQISLQRFVSQFGYKLKWDTEDFISAYQVSYDADSPENILKQFVNDVRGNGKLIKVTLYKNDILVVENETK